MTYDDPYRNQTSDNEDDDGPGCEMGLARRREDEPGRPLYPWDLGYESERARQSIAEGEQAMAEADAVRWPFLSAWNADHDLEAGA